MQDSGTPLSQVLAGERVRLAEVHAGRELKARLATMGLTRGTPLSVIRNGMRGPLVVRVGGGRLMLGRAMADKMTVTPVDE